MFTLYIGIMFNDYSQIMNINNQFSKICNNNEFFQLFSQSCILLNDCISSFFMYNNIISINQSITEYGG